MAVVVEVHLQADEVMDEDDPEVIFTEIARDDLCNNLIRKKNNTFNECYFFCPETRKAPQREPFS